MKPYLISTGYVTSLLKSANILTTPGQPRNGPSPQSRGGTWTLTRRGTALLLRAGVVLGLSLAAERPFYSDHSNPDADHSDPDSDRSDSEADHSNPDADQDHDQGGFLRQDPESEWDDHNDPLGI